VPLNLKPTVSADLRPGTSRPAFLLAYAQPQDGINNPAEYNNFGKSAAQPPIGDLSDAFTAGVNLVDNGQRHFHGHNANRQRVSSRRRPAGRSPARLLPDKCE